MGRQLGIWLLSSVNVSISLVGLSGGGIVEYLAPNISF